MFQKKINLFLNMFQMILICIIVPKIKRDVTNTNMSSDTVIISALRVKF